MNPGAWIALTALAVTVLGQLVALAFLFGGLFARMKAVEARPSDADCKAELGILNTKFEAMQTAVTEMAHDIKNLLTGRVFPANRGRGQG